MVNVASRHLHAIKLSIKRQRSFVFRSWIRIASQPFPFGDNPALVIAPHPDDEVLGCGGLIALKRKNNVDVGVVFVTGGEAAHDGCCSADRDGIAAKRRMLAERALVELDASGRPPSFSWLGFPDGRVPLPGECGFERMAREIARSIDESGVSEVFVPHYYDNHRDHKATSLATIKAVIDLGHELSVYFYCVWSLYSFARQPVLPFFVEDPLALRISDVHEKKSNAVHTYFHEKIDRCDVPISGCIPDSLLVNCLEEYEFYFRARKSG